MSSNEEEMEDSFQTEPQDLTMKRPMAATVGAGGDSQVDTSDDDDEAEEAVPPPKIGKRMDADDDNNHTVCDSTSGDTPPPEAAAAPSRKTPIPEKIVDEIIYLFQWNRFYDDMLADRKSTETLDSLKTMLETQVKTMTADAGKDRPQLVNCDNDLKHLLIKLKFLNELYDGSIEGIRSEINSYQMKDFCKE